MRAPARAQDLILVQRVKDYRAGELERRYPRLAIEEAFFLRQTADEPRLAEGATVLDALCESFRRKR